MGENHKYWWVAHRHSRFGLQTHNFDINDVILGDNQCFVYIKVSETNRENVKGNFMKYIGGQDNIFCRIDKLPLISSAEKMKLCRCGKKEKFTCTELNCRTLKKNPLQRMFQKIFILLLMLLQCLKYNNNQM